MNDLASINRPTRFPLRVLKTMANLTTRELLNSLSMFCVIWSIASILSLISFILSLRACVDTALALDREAAGNGDG